MRVVVEPSFIKFDEGPLGARFCIWTLPAEHAPRAIIVYAHPFAEEMNKSRRMASLQARRFAQLGCAVLQADQIGCGDSAGGFGDATWDLWVDDIVTACKVARQRAQRDWSSGPDLPLWIWGLRSGCLLAVQAAARANLHADFVFWQPVLAGKQVLQQFLRLGSVAARLGKPQASTAESPRDVLAAGRTAHVAGYAIAPALANGMEAARLEAPVTPCRVEWFDAAAQAGNELPPAIRQAQATWHAAGHEISMHPITGPMFWQTTEVEDAPELVAATTASMAVRIAVEAPVST